MRKSKAFFFLTGTALLLAAFSIVGYNYYEDSASGKKAMAALSDLKEIIPQSGEKFSLESGESNENDLFAKYEKEEIYDPGEIEIDGKSYIGYINIPELEIELPVMSSWSYPDLKISPCRYKGSIGGNDLIIAAHNYNSHFGRINTLTEGSEIKLTDAKGKVHQYIVVSTEELGGTDIEKMEFGSVNNWDITLFTCTLGGQSRVTVRGKRITE